VQYRLVYMVFGAESSGLPGLEAGATREILFFNGQPPEFDFLDNYHPCEFSVDGRSYNSLEHFYQSKKAKDERLQDWIRSAPTAAEASRRGRSLSPDQMVPEWGPSKLELVPDWELSKLGVMRKGMFYKFGRGDPSLRERLLATGTAVLHENSPDDVVFGIKGEDWAGRLLMETRRTLRLEQNYRS
jgi:N-glycosidase YbiA